MNDHEALPGFIRSGLLKRCKQVKVWELVNLLCRSKWRQTVEGREKINAH